MSDLSKNGNGVPASVSRFAHLGTGAYGMLPIAWAPLMHGERTIKVFWALCAHVNPSGTCFPSRAAIAEMCGIHPSHVAPTLRKLEAMGAISTVPGIGRHVSRFRVLPPPKAEVSKSDTSEVSKSDTSEVSKSDTSEVSDLAPCNRPANRVFNRTSSRACAKTSEQAKPTDDDEQADLANDLADAAFKATLGLTDEQRRANVARFAAMLGRPAKRSTQLPLHAALKNDG